MFFCHFSKDFRKLRSSDVLAILLIAYGHILPKLFEFFKLNIKIAQNIFCHFSIVVENMGVSNENLSKIDIRILFCKFFWQTQIFLLLTSLFRRQTCDAHPQICRSRQCLIYHFKVLIFLVDIHIPVL